MDIITLTGRMASGKTTRAVRLLAKAKPLGITTAFVGFADPLKTFVRKAFGIAKSGKVHGFDTGRLCYTFILTEVENYLRASYLEIQDEITLNDELNSIIESIIYNSTAMESFVKTIHLAHISTHKDLYNKAVRTILQTVGSEFGRKLHPDFWVYKNIYKLADLRKSGVDLVIIDDLRFENEHIGLKRYTSEMVVIGGSLTSLFLEASDEIVAERLKVSVDYVREASQHDSEDLSWVGLHGGFIHCLENDTAIEESVINNLFVGGADNDSL